MEAMTTVINFKDFLRSDKPEDGDDMADGAEDAFAGGDELVPDFAAAEEYIDAVETEAAEKAYAPSQVYSPPEPEKQDQGMAVSQPYYQGERKHSSDDGDSAESSVMGVSLISKEATVLGDIITEGHIDIVGKVRGNVEAEGNVAVRGLVSGDLAGEKIGLYKCRVKGNLNAGTGVVIDSDSVVVGNVDTENVVLGGKLKGDIKAVKMAVLRSDAYFIGDVETESIAVESGAVVNGSIRTLIQGDIEAPFDD